MLGVSLFKTDSPHSKTQNKMFLIIIKMLHFFNQIKSLPIDLAIPAIP